MTLVLDGTNNTYLSATERGQLMTLSTAQATTSGTSIDFTSIPTWAKKISVILNSVSTNGSSIIQIQIGGGSVETTGYVGVVDSISSTGGSTASFTSGLAIARSGGSASGSVHSGIAVFTLLSSNIWVASYTGSITGAVTMVSISNTVKTTASTLNRIRLTTVNGTDAFDAGSVNILIEGSL